MDKQIHDELIRKGYTYFEEDTYTKCYKQPVIGLHGNHGLIVSVTTEKIMINVYAPSGRIVDNVTNLSGVHKFEAPSDVVILDEWVKSIVDKVI